MLYRVKLRQSVTRDCILPGVYFGSNIALDLITGAPKVARRFSGYYAWAIACFLGGMNCPALPGPDFDFGIAPVLNIFLPVLAVKFQVVRRFWE